MSSRTGRQMGLTLIEMVVVLIILATVGTAVITQTAGLTDQARFDSTALSLESLRDGIVGRSTLPGEDPTAVPPGFVADVGRLPEAGTDLDLAELWDREATATPPATFALQPLTGLDDDLELACGWRGPYIRWPIGSDEIRDGWSQPFDLFHRDGTTVDQASDVIGAISSAGSGVGDTFDVTLDDVVFVDDGEGIDLTTGVLSLQVQFELPASPTQGQYVVVRVYGPDNGTAAVVAQSQAHQGTLGATQTITVDFTPDAVAIGPKLLRAYQWNSSTAPLLTDDLTAHPKSEARRVTVITGGTNWPDLSLEGQ